LLQYLENLHAQWIARRLAERCNSPCIGGGSRLTVKMAKIVHTPDFNIVVFVYQNIFIYD
jgi:hypothetical protein